MPDIVCIGLDRVRLGTNIINGTLWRPSWHTRIRGWGGDPIWHRIHWSDWVYEVNLIKNQQSLGCLRLNKKLVCFRFIRFPIGRVKNSIAPLSHFCFWKIGSMSRRIMHTWWWRSVGWHYPMIILVSVFVHFPGWKSYIRYRYRPGQRLEAQRDDFNFCLPYLSNYIIRKGM